MPIDDKHIFQHLETAGRALYAETKKPPSLFLVILPDGGNDIYTQVKQYDCSCNPFTFLTRDLSKFWGLHG